MQISRRSLEDEYKRQDQISQKAAKNPLVLMISVNQTRHKTRIIKIQPALTVLQVFMIFFCLLMIYIVKHEFIKQQLKYVSKFIKTHIFLYRIISNMTLSEEMTKKYLI